MNIRPINIWDPGCLQENKATIISGGQIGADIAGLRAAHACGLNTGGFMPEGFKTLMGPLDPGLVKRYNLRETTSTKYTVRTRQNIVAADATIRLAFNFDSSGEKATLRYINELKRPHLDVPIYQHTGEFFISTDPDDAAYWLKVNEPKIVNIAGNSLLQIEKLVEWFLTEVFVACRSL